MKKIAKKAMIKTLPVMAGYLVLGIAFGLLMADKGYSFLWALLMSVVIYAGSMQFVTVTLLTSGASLVSSALMTLMVNARHLFYGVSMLEKYDNTGKVKPYLIFGLTDETYALVCSEVVDAVDKKKYYFFITLFNQCYWIVGTIIGALLGTTLSINTTGIDFSMTALFVIILTEQLLSTKDYLPAMIGVTSSIVCMFFFGTSHFLIPSMIVITFALLLLEKIRQRGEQYE